MNTLKRTAGQIVSNRLFELFITIVIIVNSILIGVQATHNLPVVNNIQHIILYIFTFEILVRILAARNMKEFLSAGWNVFDLLLVIIGWIPPSVSTNASSITLVRILRTFRILRLLRASTEIKLIVTVMVKSVNSMVYNCILFMIFAYLYAVAGVTLFRLPAPETGATADEMAKYEQLMSVAPHSPANSPDPFGSISEGIFTLFRALTGEDWTDLRYNLITASDLGVIDVHPTIVTCFFVSWFCIAAFLLLNLVTGAVINNYQVAMSEIEERKKTRNNA
ncbi:MAG: ion transporter [Muribaculaceae bacterium]|nr:ion transporter [Muribaculaceae bacterium]